MGNILKAHKPFYGHVRQEQADQERLSIKCGYKGCVIKNDKIV